MSNRKDEHVHKYKKIVFKPSGHTIFRCMLVGCTHFINQELLPGRFCRCWICDKVFVVKNTLLAKPHCDDCTKKKPRKKEESIVNQIDVSKLTELLT